LYLKCCEKTGAIFKKREKIHIPYSRTVKNAMEKMGKEKKSRSDIPSDSRFEAERFILDDQASTGVNSRWKYPLHSLIWCPSTLRMEMLSLDPAFIIEVHNHDVRMAAWP
jgi:hypothetical protein